MYPLKTHLLITKIYRQKYGSHSPVGVAYYDYKGHNASWGRGDLTRAASKFKEGLRWKIRNERIVCVLEDRWCNNGTIGLRSQVNPTPSDDRPMSVLFNEFKTRWNTWEAQISLSL